MTTYQFKVNGTDFSDMVYKRGYKTVQTPVYGRTVTTMDGVRHRKLRRYRNTLITYFNAPTEARARAFCAELTSGQQITYTLLQSGQAVTETMDLAGIELSALARVSDKQWLEGFELTFEGR